VWQASVACAASPADLLRCFGKLERVLRADDIMAKAKAGGVGPEDPWLPLWYRERVPDARSAALACATFSALALRLSALSAVLSTKLLGSD
jgi:hypothetical protein